MKSSAQQSRALQPGIANCGLPHLWFNTNQVLCGRNSLVDTHPLASPPQLPESAPSLYHLLTKWLHQRYWFFVELGTQQKKISFPVVFLPHYRSDLADLQCGALTISLTCKNLDLRTRLLGTSIIELHSQKEFFCCLLEK